LILQFNSEQLESFSCQQRIKSYRSFLDLRRRCIDSFDMPTFEGDIPSRTSGRPSRRRPGVNFINVLQAAFAGADPKSVKNKIKSSVSFYAFGIFAHKSCS